MDHNSADFLTDREVEAIVNNLGDIQVKAFLKRAKTTLPDTEFPPQQMQKKKNIIFYFTDQQRFDTFNEDLMPNLYELSKQGVTFSNCFTCQPVCGPARACLQTGVYATEARCFKNGQSLPIDIPHLADYLSDAGYDTAYIGKWHLATDGGFLCEKNPIPEDRRGGYRYWRAADVLEFTSNGQGGYLFDENEDRHNFTGYRPDCINDFALEYLDSVDKNKPFFLFVSHLEPHHQNDKKRYEGFPGTRDGFADYPIPDDLSFLQGDYKQHYPDYVSAINRIDYNLGRLIEKLKDLGIFEDTVIIFTSDHGCHFKTRNAEYKRSCHDSSIHIPLVIKGGCFNDGKIRKDLVSLIDLPATILSLAGIDVPSHFKGDDLSVTADKQCVYIQISESECARAIRTKDYKYSVCVPSPIAGMTMKKSPVYTEEYLYDLTSDPNEKVNLIMDPSYKIVRSAMQKLLLSEMKKAGEGNAVIVPAVMAKKK